MTFEELTRANSSIVSTDIGKGREYAEVNQRIKAFRMLMPNGAIETELISLVDGIAIFKATVKDEDGKVLGTGTAYEKEGSSFINKTSYIENCETSAVGRALAMCGLGIDLSIASYEEVKNAQLNQQTEEDKAVAKAFDNVSATKEEMLEVIAKKYPEGSEALQKLLEYLKVKSLDKASDAQLRAVFNKCGGK